MRPSPLSLAALAILSCAAVLCLAPSARAEFTASDVQKLAAGEPVVEETTAERGYHRYVGGVSYLVVDRSAERLSQVARDVTRFRDVLPHVTSAKLLRISPSGRATVRVEHALGPFHGGYTMLVEFSEGGRMGKFWLDPGADNDLKDAWGYVRFTPLAGGTRTLVTYGILFDLGNGMVRNLFESRIKAIAFAYPKRLAHAAS